MKQLTILVAVCLFGMCHEVQASSLLNNSSSRKSSVKYSRHHKSVKASNDKTANKTEATENTATVEGDKTLDLSKVENLSVDDVKKFIEENAPIFDLNGNRFTDVDKLPKGKYFRAGQKIEVQ